MRKEGEGPEGQKLKERERGTALSPFSRLVNRYGCVCVREDQHNEQMGNFG